MVAAIVVPAFALVQISKNRLQIKRWILNRFNVGSKVGPAESWEPGRSDAERGSSDLTPEESKAELQRLHKFVEVQKQIAWDTDIAYHLWGLYRTLFRPSGAHPLERYVEDGEWYKVKILKASSNDGLNQYEFELKGARYKFVDDEERQDWHVKMKLFSLFLYDESGRCLIQIPMKMIIDGLGSSYAIAAGGPKAFLSGSWINDFINVELKHQSMRNQEIREEKHRERLCEIEDLKNRFGTPD